MKLLFRLIEITITTYFLEVPMHYLFDTVAAEIEASLRRYRAIRQRKIIFIPKLRKAMNGRIPITIHYHFLRFQDFPIRFLH